MLADVVRPPCLHGGQAGRQRQLRRPHSPAPPLASSHAMPAAARACSRLLAISIGGLLCFADVVARPAHDLQQPATRRRHDGASQLAVLCAAAYRRRHTRPRRRGHAHTRPARPVRATRPSPVLPGAGSPAARRAPWQQSCQRSSGEDRLAAVLQPQQPKPWPSGLMASYGSA